MASNSENATKNVERHIIIADDTPPIDLESGHLSRRRRYSKRVSSELNQDDDIGVVRSTKPQTANATLPIEYRTLSFGVADSKSREKNQPDVIGNTETIVDEISQLDWHTVSVSEVCNRLSTSTTRGLEQNQVSRKLSEFGKNQHSPPPSHLFRRIFFYIFGGFGSLLIIGGILCCVSWKPLGEPAPQVANLALGVVLFMVAALQAFFNAWQDWSSSRVVASITGMLPSDVIVIRDGASTSLPASNLVPGDIVQVNLGNKIPADLRMFEASMDMKFDRSILTGESDAIHASTESTSDNFLESKNIAMQGTHCVSGTGLGIVIYTGDRTIFGRIAKLSSKRQTRLATLQKEILRFVLVIISLIVVVSTIVLIVWGAFVRKKHPEFLTVAGIIVDVVSVSVAFIPEGLPIAVTTTLTVIAYAMKKQKVLCKSLATVETLGAVNIIFSDKTGTLTQNSMWVVNTAIANSEFTPEEARNKLADDDSSSVRAIKQLWHVATLCCAAKFDSASSNLPLREKKVHGDATDQAVLRLSEMLKSDQSMKLSDTPNEANWNKTAEVPFNSRNKFMIRLYSNTDLETVKPAIADSEFETMTRSDAILFMKGAPDIILPRCSSILLPTGEITSLTEQYREQLSATQDRWAGRGQRVLLLVRRIVPASIIEKGQVKERDYEDFLVKECALNLTVVGLIGIADPPRLDIPDVVRICRGGGIRFFMVTGDFARTAEAIARQVGIITTATENVDTVAALIRRPEDSDEIEKSKSMAQHSSSIVISGSELISLNEYQWEQLCTYEEVVFARTSPEQKLRIIKEYQGRENCVAMTGDGVNDAPSLKAADIGIAMGSGSDVAIEASDMVLLDSFAAIVVAIEYGRLVFDNLKKTIIYLLPAGSFSELWPVLLNVFFGLPQVLSSFLMIVICCLTDCMAAITLVFEKPEADLLTRPPRNLKKDRLANPRLILHAYGFIGILECFCSMAMAFWYLQHSRNIPFSVLFLSFGSYPEQYDPVEVNAAVNTASSIYFVNLVVMQFFNLFATRTRKLSILQQPPLFRKSTQNLWLFPAMVWAIAVAFFFLYIPWFQKVLSTTHVPVAHWFIPIGLGMGVLIIDEIRKWICRRYPNSLLAKIAW